jgi:SAM-dependent methyltransferase
VIDKRSNEIWAAPQRPETFESRAHRFRDDMRPLLFQWLGITPESKVLDGGCGSGVFTRYLAKGLTSGHITGFDINEGFIEYGKGRAGELNLEHKVTLEIDDGFNLHYADNSFDAVTNYTYIGVLSDPEAGMRELVRVCRLGGTVSYLGAPNSFPYVGWQGDYPFGGAEELQRLAALENVIFVSFVRKPSDFNQSNTWGSPRYPRLFEVCGLSDIHIYPLGHLICYSDSSYPPEYRRQLAITETEEEISWLFSRYEGKEDVYAEHGFSRDDLNRLVILLGRKLGYLREHFETDKSYEWHGGFNFIVTGRKIDFLRKD